MRYIRPFLAILLAFVLPFFCGAEMFAAGNGFSFDSPSKDEEDSILKSINISVLTEEPPKMSISCFDVSSDGIVAIGCENGESKTVCLYTRDGIFRYGYGFDCYGKFGIEFEDDLLNIYLVRGGISVAVDSEGKVKSVLEIQKTTENNDFWNNRIFSNSRKIGNTEYILENDMGIFNLFASSYSQVVVVNENGEKSIIYDVNSAQLLKTVAVYVGILVFVFIAVAVIVRLVVKKKSENRVRV